MNLSAIQPVSCLQLALGLGLFAFGWLLFRYGTYTAGFCLGFICGYKLYEFLLRFLAAAAPDLSKMGTQSQASILLPACIFGITGIFLAHRFFRISIFAGSLAGVLYIFYATPQRIYVDKALEKAGLLSPLSDTFSTVWPVLMALFISWIFVSLGKYGIILLTSCLGSSLLSSGFHIPALFLPLCLAGCIVQSHTRKNFSNRLTEKEAMEEDELDDEADEEILEPVEAEARHSPWHHRLRWQFEQLPGFVDYFKTKFKNKKIPGIISVTKTWNQSLQWLKQYIDPLVNVLKTPCNKISDDPLPIIKIADQTNVSPNCLLARFGRKTSGLKEPHHSLDQNPITKTPLLCLPEKAEEKEISLLLWPERQIHYIISCFYDRNRIPPSNELPEIKIAEETTVTHHSLPDRLRKQVSGIIRHFHNRITIRKHT